MYQLGHYGVSLLVYAPVGYLFVTRGEIALAFVTGAVMLGLAMLPDCDHRLPFCDHRGPTHSLLFAGFVGATFAAAGHVLAPSLPFDPGVDPIAFGFFLGSVTVLSHLLADTLTPMGVNYLWPVSRKRYTISLTPAKSPVANYLLFALGVFVASASMALALGIV
ncbi:metal-dependent hydrolase [Halegenticoccus tardaugens]|uniref:metal-dependent hydrolase n=1 Tax=Halegenticoccus tardaugens TaxID=2071624 RepID=UPI00100A75CA|nr:metal-dependent hydrolase [Halegenticoccus tardaugens]